MDSKRDWERLWAEGETPWDKGAPAPPLLELLETETGQWLRGKGVLVPGCGSGHDVRALASWGAKATGLDISPAAIACAESRSLASDVEFICGNLFDWSAEAFDAVWEHTCFCAIEPDDRVRYAEACSRLVRPGGVLAGVFYLEPWLPGEIPEPPPYGAEKEEIIEILSPYFSLNWAKIPDRSYSGREGREWLAVFERTNHDRRVAD